MLKELSKSLASTIFPYGPTDWQIQFNGFLISQYYTYEVIFVQREATGRDDHFLRILFLARSDDVTGAPTYLLNQG